MRLNLISPSDERAPFLAVFGLPKRTPSVCCRFFVSFPGTLKDGRRQSRETVCRLPPSLPSKGPPSLIHFPIPYRLLSHGTSDSFLRFFFRELTLPAGSAHVREEHGLPQWLSRKEAVCSSFFHFRLSDFLIFFSLFCMGFDESRTLGRSSLVCLFASSLDVPEATWFSRSVLLWCVCILVGVPLALYRRSDRK